jgi:hypothetical protein
MACITPTATLAEVTASYRDTATTWETREPQYDAVCTWGIPNHGLLQRLSASRHASVGGQWRRRSDDPAALLPACRPDPQAQVKIYPDAVHGFLFQHRAEFAADVETFLDRQ